MIKSLKTALFIAALYISIAGLVTFSQFICEEAFQTVMFGTWPAKNAKQWPLVKTGITLMEKINDRSKGINRWFGWIQPIAWFSYDAYCDAADYYIAGLRAETFANAPELFVDERVSFTFKPREIVFTDGGLFLARNGRIGVITGEDIKISRMTVDGILVRYKKLYVIHLDKFEKEGVANGNRIDSNG